MCNEWQWTGISNWHSGVKCFEMCVTEQHVMLCICSLFSPSFPFFTWINRKLQVVCFLRLTGKKSVKDMLGCRFTLVPLNMARSWYGCQRDNSLGPQQCIWLQTMMWQTKILCGLCFVLGYVPTEDIFGNSCCLLHYSGTANLRECWWGILSNIPEVIVFLSGSPTSL